MKTRTPLAMKWEASKGHNNTIQIYFVTVMTLAIALKMRQSGQPITPV